MLIGVYAINYATKNKYLRRLLFDVVGLLRGDRFCGESVDVLGDRFVIEIRGYYQKTLGFYSRDIGLVCFCIDF